MSHTASDEDSWTSGSEVYFSDLDPAYQPTVKLESEDSDGRDTGVRPKKGRNRRISVPKEASKRRPTVQRNRGSKKAKKVSNLHHISI